MFICCAVTVETYCTTSVYGSVAMVNERVTSVLLPELLTALIVTVCVPTESMEGR